MASFGHKGHTYYDMFMNLANTSYQPQNRARPFLSIWSGSPAGLFPPSKGLGASFMAGLPVWTRTALPIEPRVFVPSNQGGCVGWPGRLYELLMFLDVSWCGKTRRNAVTSIAFADYLLEVLARPADPISPWTTKIAALGCVALVGGNDCLGTTGKNNGH
ncbi:hypothetical protein F4802DRAFT_478128 [Xylaria palmicola]|nr:hypothetical protein F4802DRAFT_478128 [Xylaria palmicola]